MLVPCKMTMFLLVPKKPTSLLQRPPSHDRVTPRTSTRLYFGCLHLSDETKISKQNTSIPALDTPRHTAPTLLQLWLPTTNTVQHGGGATMTTKIETDEMTGQITGKGIGRTEAMIGGGHESDMSAGDHGLPTLAANDDDEAETETGREIATKTATDTDEGEDRATATTTTALAGNDTATTSQTTNLVPHDAVPSDGARPSLRKRPPSPSPPAKSQRNLKRNPTSATPVSSPLPPTPSHRLTAPPSRSSTTSLLRRASLPRATSGGSSSSKTGTSSTR